MRNFKVAVIGGGFSGLCAAVKLGKVFNEKLFILTNVFAFSEGGEGAYA